MDEVTTEEESPGSIEQEAGARTGETLTIWAKNPSEEDTDRAVGLAKDAVKFFQMSRGAAFNLDESSGSLAY